MKTTLDLPDELLRAIKVRAVREDRRLKDLIAELLRKGMAVEQERPGMSGHRVQLPLVHCAHGADRDEEMTPDRLAEVLTEEEARGAATR